MKTTLLSADGKQHRVRSISESHTANVSDQNYSRFTC